MKRIPLTRTRTANISTILRDPRSSPKRNDQVLIDGDTLTVEFVSDVGPTVSLVGYRTTGPQGQRVVGLSEWRQMCSDADGAIDPSAVFN